MDAAWFDRDRLCGIAAVMKLDVGIIGEHPPDRLADHGLIVNEQHHAHIGVRRFRLNRFTHV